MTGDRLAHEGVEWLKSVRGTKWTSVEEGGRERPVGDLAEALLAERDALVNIAKAARDVAPAPIKFSDPRIEWMDIQVDVDDWNAFCEALSVLELGTRTGPEHEQTEPEAAG